ncbi:hypothetical protein KEM60_01393 [Austwickia sp. TVS 96-490-7B]|uniref:hypothetical protein n=1 Tax=Austwickia sp. TVS 96-490-7B TaxID=2830843 RepID=UPI001C5786AC|nr:hypothetical protein [Austwickia sp. TVS 96-490-7B]MBW3085196.1 hypothetical protein [Austwickia sp. TVS 96-490-7B]
MSANPVGMRGAQVTRTTRRQLHHVELQGLDTSRIISSLSGRGGRRWPTTPRDERH